MGPLKSEWKQFNELNSASYESPEALHEYGERAGLWAVETELVRKFFRVAGLTLDIGCGAGRTTIGLSQMGCPTVGMDLSMTLVQAARTKYPPISFIQGNVCSLPFSSGCFDQAIFSFNGFDYVCPEGNFSIGLREIRRVLKPRGVLVYSGHNIVGLFGRHIRPLRKFVTVGIPEVIETLGLQTRGSSLSSWYWRFKEPFGELIVFCAPPWVHKRLHRQAGFETIGVFGGLFETKHRSEKWLTFREHHLHYVLRRTD